MLSVLPFAGLFALAMTPVAARNGHDYLYLSSESTVFVFDAKKTAGGPVAQIPNLADEPGLYVDPSGNLYVPQAAKYVTGYVNVYPPGKTTASEQLSINYNYSPAFNPCGDGAGNVYVLGGSQPESVALFAFGPGQADPTFRFPFPLGVQCTTDAAGDLFVWSVVTGGPTVLWNIFEFPHPVTKNGDSMLVQSGHSQFFGGLYMGFDASNRLVTAMQGTFSIYAAPYTGAPVAQFPAPAIGPFAFDERGRTLWVAAGAEAIELHYPSGKQTGRTASINGTIKGIAIGPAVQP